MRPFKWTTKTITEFLEDNDIGLEPTQDVVGIKHLVPWKCRICGKNHEVTFDRIVLQHSVHSAKPQTYCYCPHCRYDSKANTFDATSLTAATSDSAFLAGLVAARSVTQLPRIGDRQARTKLGASERPILETIAARIGTDAKISALQHGFALIVENDAFAEASIKTSVIPSDDAYARAWTRGYFERRGSVEMYRFDGKKIHRITVTGPKNALDPILKAFHDAGNAHGAIQLHVRKSGTTWEMHFSGERSAVKFIEWMGEPPTWFRGMPSVTYGNAAISLFRSEEKYKTRNAEKEKALAELSEIIRVRRTFSLSRKKKELELPECVNMWTVGIAERMTRRGVPEWKIGKLVEAISEKKRLKSLFEKRASFWARRLNLEITSLYALSSALAKKRNP